MTRFIVALFMMLGFVLAPPASADKPHPRTAVPIYTFVSMPDFMNADIGDVSGRPGWDPGDPNSINTSYNTAVDTILQDVMTHNPDDIYVAGDLVEGHWGQDIDNTGIFGPVDTDAQRTAAIYEAAHTYDRKWNNFFERNGFNSLNIYPAVGDHDIGDNGWPVDSFKFGAVPDFKKAFGDTFLPDGRFKRRPFGTPFENTSYVTTLAGGNVVLLTLDEFAKWSDGIHMTVANKYLEWVESVLATTLPSQTVIVQGHVPVLMPVRETGSSGLHLEDAENSALWKLMNKYNVDFYFSGEVHNDTARVSDTGPVQISHGGLIAYNGQKYMVGTVYDDGTVDLETYRFLNATSDRTDRMWQTSDRRPPISVWYPDHATLVGNMHTINGHVYCATGDLELNNVTIPAPAVDPTCVP